MDVYPRERKLFRGPRTALVALLGDVDALTTISAGIEAACRGIDADTVPALEGVRFALYKYSNTAGVAEKLALGTVEYDIAGDEMKIIIGNF